METLIKNAETTSKVKVNSVVHLFKDFDLIDNKKITEKAVGQTYSKLLRSVSEERKEMLFTGKGCRRCSRALK